VTPVAKFLLDQKIAFGTAGLSVAVPTERSAARAVVHAALDADVRILDTAACYIPDHREIGHNEKLIADALRTWSGDAETVLVTTKGGTIRLTTTSDYGADLHDCGCRRCLIADCDNSLNALGVEQIALYQTHHFDPRIAVEDTMETLVYLQTSGKIGEIGLSNISVEQLERAVRIAPISSVQNRLNPSDLSSLEVVRKCDELGIAFMAYSPLGGLGGAARRLAARNDSFTSVAVRRGVSPQQVMLAWARALSRVVIPVVGARKVQTIRDSAHGVDLLLSDRDLTELNSAVFSAALSPEGRR
jgi:aryl-alcohol dehydrogenase-like predicted oxidoreductase